MLTAALVAAVLVFAVGPPRPRRTASPDPPDARTIAGAYHIHTTRSDGALDRDAVAAAAARAGLQFAIFSDHGDGTSAPLPPAYVHGVLCIDGVEVSTDDGHYVALGIGRAPYPLGGDGAAVAEDVTRLGGFGIAAHPVSAKRELAWGDWAVPFEGLEWLNADSEWRDERRTTIARALLGYLWRPGGALGLLLDRPVSTLGQWDALAATRRVIALAAHDAHGGFGRENGGTSGRRLHIPSYEASFRTFSIRLGLAAAPTGDATTDAAAVLAAIRKGAAFSVIDAIATPGSLDFHAVAGSNTFGMGETLPATSEPARFSVRADVPAGATTLLLRNGAVVAQREGGALEQASTEAGAYRVEIRVAGAPGTPPVPWLVSNPIFRFEKLASDAAPEATGGSLGTPLGPGWRTERSPGSDARVNQDPSSVRFSYRLAGGEAASQFAALVRDLQSGMDGSVVVFEASASRPMRVSAQLRFARDGGVRWRKSFYVDGTAREVRIPLAGLRPADGPGTRPALDRATSLLLVVDLTNATPGSEGSFDVAGVRLIR